jgi:hypothetical protein
MDACTVSSLTVGIHGTAVPDGFQGGDPCLHDVAPAFAIERANEAHAARIMFLRRIVGMTQGLGVGLSGGEELASRFRVGHGGGPTMSTPRLLRRRDIRETPAHSAATGSAARRSRWR